jgi:hypothetical protein
MLNNSFQSRFIVGGVVPVVLFYLLHRAGQTLTGAIVAGGWGFGVTIVTYWLSRKVNIFAVLATTVNLVEIVGTLLTRNPDFYLAGAAIDSFLYAILFLGSLLLARSLMQLLVEAAPQGRRFSESFRQQPMYRKAWQIVTAVWGVAYLVKAGLLVWGQINLSLELFLTIRTLFNFPLFIGLMIFSYWFPARYWKKRGATNGR